MENNPAVPVKKSLGRCLHHGDVFGTFYERFLESDPEIPEQFANTDWEEQKALLRHGINKVIGFYEGSFAGQNALERIRYTHGRDRMNIPPRLYEFWIESMIEAVKRFDPQVDSVLEDQWREVLRYGTDFVKAGYEE